MIRLKNISCFFLCIFVGNEDGGEPVACNLSPDQEAEVPIGKFERLCSMLIMEYLFNDNEVYLYLEYK